MTPTHKFVVFKGEEGICRVQELGMENDLDTIVDSVEQVATADAKKNKNKKIKKLK